jgi:hypothetical protein
LMIKIRNTLNDHEAALIAKIPAAQRKPFLAALHALWDAD